MKYNNTGIDISVGNKGIKFRNQSIPGTPPLIEFFSIAANAFNGSYDIKSGKIEEHISRYCWSNCSNHADSFTEMTLGLISLFNNNHANFNRKLKYGLGLWSSNLYIVSMLGDNNINSANIEEWSERRLQILGSWIGKQDIFSIGDSHGHYPYFGMARCETFFPSSSTMYRIGARGFSSVNFDHGRIPKAVNVVLSYGEIDARVHIARQEIRQGVEAAKIIDSVVGAYFAEIKKFFADREDLRIAVSGLVPPVREATYVGHITGSDAKRLAIHRHFNGAIADQCDRHGLAYIDVYKDFCDDEGFLHPALGAVDHHLPNTVCDQLERILAQTLGLQYRGSSLHCYPDFESQPPESGLSG